MGYRVNYPNTPAITPEQVKAEMLRRARARLGLAETQASAAPMVSQEDLASSQTAELDRQTALGLQNAANKIGNYGGEASSTEALGKTFEGMGAADRQGLAQRQQRYTQGQAELRQAEEGLTNASKFGIETDRNAREVESYNRNKAWEDQKRPLELKGLEQGNTLQGEQIKGAQTGNAMGRLNLGNAQALQDPKSTESFAVNAAAGTQINMQADAFDKMNNPAGAKLRAAWTAFQAKNPNALQTRAFLQSWSIDPKEAMLLAGGRKQPQSTKEAFDMERSLNAQYQGLPAVKRADEVRSMQSTLEAAYRQGQKGNQAISDVALIFAYMKILDPGSVVREGEYATVRQTGGIPSQVWSQWLKVTGGGQLTPEIRKQIVETSRSKTQGELDNLGRINREYQGIATRWGIDPTGLVVIPDSLEGAQPITLDVSKIDTGTGQGQSKPVSGAYGPSGYGQPKKQIYNGIDLPPL